MGKLVTELRAAAASARAFADSVGSPELKRAFQGMAVRWEIEADECEREDRLKKLGTSARPRAFSCEAPAWRRD